MSAQTELGMAQELIDHIKRTHTPRLALLEDRIEATLHYMDQVTTPNQHTLSHIRGFLTGERDNSLAGWVADKIETESES